MLTFQLFVWGHIVTSVHLFAERKKIRLNRENLDRERKTFGFPFNQLANEINEFDLTFKEQLKQGFPNVFI
jgi:hypothetical protein